VGPSGGRARFAATDAASQRYQRCVPVTQRRPTRIRVPTGARLHRTRPTYDDRSTDGGPVPVGRRLSVAAAKLARLGCSLMVIIVGVGPLGATLPPLRVRTPSVRKRMS
jgi:hypothetical protein